MAYGLTTELGGEFIDSNHKDMLSLCSEFNLPLLDLLGESEASFIKDSYFFNDRFYSTKEVIEAFKPYAAKIQADIDSLPGTITFNNYGNAQHFDKLSISEYFDSIGMQGWIRKALEVAYLTEYGREVDDQSSINFLFLFSPDTTKGNFDIFGTSDERYKIEGGNQKLIDALYQQVKHQVQFEHKLTKIKEKNNGTYNLSFVCGGGSTKEVAADIVVAAIPFTTLRLAEIDVKMPEFKRNAIQHLGYGTNSKLLLGFNKRIWRDYNYSGYVFSDGAVQNGWDNSLLQPGNKGGFTAFLGGKAGLALGSGTPDAQAAKFVNQLNHIWQGCKSAYNGNAEKMFWPAYPFSLGSYACYTPGQWTTIAGAERRHIRNLLFAGEHCSLSFQGFMNGAAQTGRKAAEDILSTLKFGKQIQNSAEEENALYSNKITSLV